MYTIKLDKTDIVTDCGENVGEITSQLCKSGAAVYAFEPNPFAFRVLQEKFIDTKNVHCINKGVCDKTGKLKLYIHENSGENKVYWSTGSSLLSFKNNVLADKYVEVEVVDLCEFIESLNHRFRILKTDVEGVKNVILEKLIHNDVINRIDNIFVETHDDKIPEFKEGTSAIRKLIQDRNITNIDLSWT